MATIVIVLGSVVGTGLGATSPAGDAKLERIAHGLVEAGAPGALVVVRTPDGVRRAAEGFGDVERKTPLRATDRYRAASVTKSFVAAVVMQLVADRRLRLSETVERWLPGLVPHGASITLRQLLTHTSGVFDYDQDPTWVGARFANPAREWAPRTLVKVATAHPLRFRPGTNWAYSNTNYVLLGLVVEAATGHTLAQELQARIFRPLGLRSTSYPGGTAMPGRFAHGYVVGRPPLPVPVGKLVDTSTIVNPSAWGAGQIVSTADDLTRFFVSLLQGRLVDGSELKQMKTRALGHDYGFGLAIAETACGTAYGHDGDMPGYRNVVWATADGRRAASVMVNVDETRVSWSKLQDAAKAALCSA